MTSCRLSKLCVTCVLERRGLGRGGGGAYFLDNSLFQYIVPSTTGETFSTMVSVQIIFEFNNREILLIGFLRIS